MPRHTFIAILFIALLPTVFLAAQKQGGGNHGSGMGPRHGGGQLIAPELNVEQPHHLEPLKQFVNLSDKQLLAIRDVIDQILEMTPKQRAALKKKVGEYAKLNPQKQQMIRQGWNWGSDQEKYDWREMMQSATEEERRVIQNELQQLAPAEKGDYRLKLVKEWKKKQSK